jgi:hypothetical protein
MKMGPRHSHLCHEALGEPVGPLALARDVSCKKWWNVVIYLYILLKTHGGVRCHRDMMKVKGKVNVSLLQAMEAHRVARG